MASSSSSSNSWNSWILSLKVLLISAGAVSVAITMKLTVPLMLNFAVNELPEIWSVIVSWLKPPYLYVIINGIIITIVASTRFQHHENQNQSQHQLDPPNALPPSDLTSDLPPVSIQPSFGVMESPAEAYDAEPIVIVEPPVVYESKRADLAVSGPEVVDGDRVEFVTSTSTWNPSHSVINSPLPMKTIQPEFNFPIREKQLVNSRFAHNRKPTKTNPEGARALRVLKPKKHETLDSTWKMITDGRRMPLTRHLRRSDSSENIQQQDRQSDEFISAAMKKVVRKSETFKDRRSNYENENQYLQQSPINSSPASGGKLKSEGLLSHDELNRRVEAFIKKFNDDMRLQRQESLNQYMEMVNRGAH